MNQNPGQSGPSHTGAFARRERVSPLKTNRFAGPIFLVGVFVLLVCSVFIRVVQVRYGQEIQQNRAKMVEVCSDVRDLRSQKAGFTSYASIENEAKRMGMVFPRRASRTLVVEVPEGTVPPTWGDDKSKSGFAGRRSSGKHRLMATREETVP